MATAVKYPVESIQIPANSAAGDGEFVWDFDVAEIRKLCKRFRISDPVVIKFAGRGITKNGCHRYYKRNGKTFHSITLVQYRGIEGANKTLIHELVHAKQSEKMGEKAWNSKRKNPEFSKEKIEKEARDTADKLSATISLLY